MNSDITEEEWDFIMMPNLYCMECFSIKYEIDEDFCPINWHNHLTTSDIVGVYYFSVPKSMKGGNISFQTDDYDL